jgi:hypothetical protein
MRRCARETTSCARVWSSLSTTLLTMANEKKFRNGPRTNDSGTTHASVSESTIDEKDDDDGEDDDDAIIATVEDEGSRSIVVNAPSTGNGDARRMGAPRANGAARPTAEPDDDDDDIARRAGWTGEKLAQCGAARSNVATALSTVIAVPGLGDSLILRNPSYR